MNSRVNVRGDLVDILFSVREVYPQELTLFSGTDRGVHFKFEGDGAMGEVGTVFSESRAGKTGADAESEKHIDTPKFEG